jgi:hypothetical protein
MRNPSDGERERANNMIRFILILWHFPCLLCFFCAAWRVIHVSFPLKLVESLLLCHGNPVSFLSGRLSLTLEVREGMLVEAHSHTLLSRRRGSHLGFR